MIGFIERNSRQHSPVFVREVDEIVPRRHHDLGDQQEVDRLFALMRRGTSTTASLPHGRGSPTAEQIVTSLREAETDLSAHEVAERIGISRATAQRYLSALTRSDVVSLELRYGSTGRPSTATG